MQDCEKIERLWLLKEVKDETRKRFLQLGRIAVYSKDRLCLRGQEESPDNFFILDGKVQIYTLTKCGKKKILFILGRDNIANDSIVYPSRVIFCETMELCRFYLIRRELLLSLMEKDFLLTKALLEYQERKVFRLEHQLQNTVGSIYLERRLASKLWKLARDFGRQTDKGMLIDMDLSVTFLADLLGVPRETTSRVCKRLANQGLIFMEKKKIYIPDMERMAVFHTK